MYEWQKQIQQIVNEIDGCLADRRDEALTLRDLAGKLGYSEFHMTRKFREITGMGFRDYLQGRKLAFALKEVRDSEKSMLDIALDYGFSSNEAFTRAFKRSYGVTPSQYRKSPRPVVLRTKISPFDRYFLGLGEIGMVKSSEDVKIYFVTIPAHKFLHIKNYESNGYWDFWQRQNRIPGQDYETVCGLLDSIGGKLDDDGGQEINCGSGQIMAYINDPKGRLCAWGIPRTECWGIRLPADYSGEIPSQMYLADVPEGEYLVFEHGAFDYEQENCTVEEKIEEAMAGFDYEGAGCRLDTAPGRVMYFYYDPQRYFKYVRPVRREK
ncbi:AraC family transcriptional regulator [Lachnoclostridium sp. An14]|uniref:helix-turn-helix transcriptional regulator n=1 Tax=Lachnoclostridium sp. An14 TaxID=1965562 RepID=UPI000B38BD58|nr:helix-turn-helix transcriptional regulator [Lachnoclostridium sp. An14]OUQ15757.1 AraC family transcriptional regulator [Lachnoclostridium sp. An14]